ncbi:hypothetical protein BGZ65_007844 [Modicella reniformis]|uniref:F-box/LRR-repeat protein 15/At3g58940/PEG3-like LRR domain-containing protein n=1 Tax=Modicella reniformis TaxID=1440133 RepID=A0A9P6IMT7_9FUNG|nr:hypothetical protein BGZ65_007844 [Modicella reniformis]
MVSPHPLELPEVILCVAKFVPDYGRPICARVSKVWYQAFSLTIWRHLKLGYGKTRPSSTALFKHHHLIKAFELNGDPKLTDEPLSFPNLEFLRLSAGKKGEPNFSDWVIAHPSLTRLSLDQFMDSSLSALWENLVGFRHLRDLTLSRVSIVNADLDTFWQLCTHLERLNLREVRIPGEGNLSSMEFPSMKEVQVWNINSGVAVNLEFLRRCPHLAAFTWISWNRLVDEQFVAEFNPLIDARTWPDLHEFCVRSQSITQEDLSKILSCMKRITALDIRTIKKVFGPESMDQIQPHFANLGALYIESRRGITSMMSQEILTCCPLLEKFWGYQMDATDIVEGRPWVCLRLQEFAACFCFTPSNITQLQPLVFEQLSKLTKLRRLFLDSNGASGFQETIDLRLENGLGKLSSLRSLSSISFIDTEQKMQEQEIDWMVENWTSLEEVYGLLNTRESDDQKAMKRRLQRNGVRVFLE